MVYKTRSLTNASRKVSIENELTSVREKSTEREREREREGERERENWEEKYLVNLR